MPISNAEAHRLKEEDGASVIVTCADCGEQVWTADAIYIEGSDEWYCDDCNDDLL